MLTKSDYIKYLQCHKYLWLNKNRKDLLPEETDKELERAFATGYEVEELAYKLYPGGVNAGEGEFRNEMFGVRSGIQSFRDVWGQVWNPVLYECGNKS